MAMDSYFREKFSNAVYCLAGMGDIRSRVEHAFAAAITVNAEGFSDRGLGARYADLFSRATARDEEHPGQGRIRATLSNLSEEEVAEIAHGIVEIHNELLRAANRE